jgi:hypothetical protein
VAICNFCRRTFRNPQAVRAHLKSCPVYRRTEPTRPAPRHNQLREDERLLDHLFASSGMSIPSPRVSASDEPKPGSVSRPGARPAQHPAAEDLRQQRQARAEVNRRAEAARQERATRIRTLVQEIKFFAVDAHFQWPPVPPAALADAKIALERELPTHPLLDLPRLEVQQIAVGIRDKVYARYRTPAVAVPTPSTSLITPTPSYLSPKEAAMPMQKVLSGYFECPVCEEEYELDRVPELEAKCDACHVKLVEVEDDDGE